jgi:hypothetical protein
MRKHLTTGGYKFGLLVQDVVTSRQFLTKRTQQPLKELNDDHQQSASPQFS